MDVFAKLTEQIIDGQHVINIQKGDQFSSECNLVEDFQLLLQLSLHMIHLISHLPQSEEEGFNFKRVVHQLVSANPRGQEGESLLHLSVDPKISLTSEEFFSPFPSLAVVQILIDCGADINAVDHKRNTALHNSIKFLTYSELQNEGILACL